MKKGVRIVKYNYIVHCNSCNVNYIIHEYIGRCLYCGSANVKFVPFNDNKGLCPSWLNKNGFTIGFELKNVRR